MDYGSTYVEWVLAGMDALALLTITLLCKSLTVAGLSRKNREEPGKKHYNSGLLGIEGCSPVSDDRQQDMYLRLSETLVDHIILSKVAFTSLMTTDNAETKATLQTKTADFVVCDREFKVTAVVFLDDRETRNKGRIARIDAIMRRAGHKVLRYTEIPKRTQLAADIKKPRSRRKLKPVEPHVLFNERQAQYGERRRSVERRSGVTYFDDNFIERRDTPDRRENHPNVTHIGGFIERQRNAS